MTLVHDPRQGHSSISPQAQGARLYSRNPQAHETPIVLVVFGGGGGFMVAPKPIEMCPCHLTN